MGFFSNLQRSKSALNALPRFSRSRPTPAAPSSLRQGSSFFTCCGRPTLLSASLRASPSSAAVQLRSSFKTSPSSSELFRAGKTRSIAERAVEAMKHEQVRDKTKPKLYLVIALFCSMLCLYHIAGRRSKQITSEYSASPLASPSSSSSAELPSYLYGHQVIMPGPQPFQAGRTRSIAERLVEAIKHAQVCEKEKTKLDRCSLWSFGISDGLSVSRSCKMQVWRNLDHESPSWTVCLEGPGWRAMVLDCPDLSAGCLTGGEIAVSPESLNLCKTDAETATFNAHEVGHTMASHEAEMLVRDLCQVIRNIQIVEPIAFFLSMFPNVKMIMKDHCLVLGLPLPPPYVMIGVLCSLLVFCSLLAISFACL